MNKPQKLYEKSGDWYIEIKVNSYVYVARFVERYRLEFSLPSAAFMGHIGYALTKVRYEPESK